jgi:uncharacterized phage infection (PIP) family protein YhgE
MDVEEILNQIRERVVAEHSVRPDETALVTNGSSSNGSSPAANYDDALQRLRTHLAIAGRAADRLPPVFSSRQGTRARLELWIKNKSKPLTRWFTWEQVNFNRAVNDALDDVVEILKGEAQELAALRRQLSQEMQAVRAEADERAHELQSSQALFRSEIEARLQQLKQEMRSLTTETAEQANNYARQHSSLAADYQRLLTEHTKLADQVIDLAAQLRAEDREIKSAQDEEINRRLSQLAADLKEEQRVCFRQISLETGEAAVLEDRARRALLSRLERLEKVLKTGKR